MDGYPYDTPPEAPRLRQTASYTALIRRQQQEQLAALYPHPSPLSFPPEPESFEPVSVSQDAPFSTSYYDPGHRPFQQQQHPQHVQAPYWSASTTNSTSTYFTQSSNAPYSFPPSDVSRTYHTTRSAPTGSFSNLQDIERRPFQSPVDVKQQQRMADVQPEARRFSEADFRPTGLTAAQTEEAKALDLDESGKFGEMVDRKVEANTRKGKGREASTSSASTKEFSPDDGEEKGVTIDAVLDEMRLSRKEYDTLSPARKRQIRNKVSARAFRARKKSIQEELEGQLAERDATIASLQDEIQRLQSKQEN